MTFTRISLQPRVRLGLALGAVLICGSLMTTRAEAPRQEVSSAKRMVVAGARYQASWLHRLFLGRDYRALWATPVRIDVLDLRTCAGGLRPIMRVGGMQTLGLALQGADGRSYTFRGVDKDPTAFLPDSFQGTLASRLVQDQTAAAHPAGAVVVPPLAEAAGILHTEPRLVVLPDDPVLGEFREVFAGALGSFEEYPTPPGEGRPGTFGAEAILSSLEMWSRLAAGPNERIDARAFLRARLFDAWLGDWDRHRRQWRWARLPGSRLWQPIPEDRDQVFASYEGIMLNWVRVQNPQLIVFKDSYPKLEGLTWNARDIDRWILPELDRETWRDIARDLQSRLSDERIETALRRMPPEYHRLSGEALSAALRRRRDRLPDLADRFYRFLAREVDIQATDRPETAAIRHLPDGGLEIRLKDAEDAHEPYFRRTFHADETREVRVYLRGGNDVVVSSGRPSRRIRVRIIGGSGDDTLDDSHSGGIRFYDRRAGSRIARGPGTRLDARPYTAPVVDPDTPWMPARDWGRRTFPRFWPGFTTDYGLLLGYGIQSFGYGFRKYPHADHHQLRGGYAFGARRMAFEYMGEFRNPNSALHQSLTLRASGIEILRFYGFGNRTAADLPEEEYKIRQNQYIIFPALHWSIDPRLELSVGPELKMARTDLGQDSLLNRLRPYGAENFVQMGFRLRLIYDSRGRDRPVGGGLRLQTEGVAFPAVWDVKQGFGSWEGRISGYLPMGRRLMMAARVGGKKVWGTYPFHEAAYLGGPETLRGFRKERFAGDACLFGNLELRVTLGKALLVIPGEYGIFALGDVGRVFLDGESSRKWHTAAGGGFFFSVVDLASTFSIAAAVSRERTSLYFRAGFSF